MRKQKFRLLDYLLNNYFVELVHNLDQHPHQKCDFGGSWRDEEVIEF